MEPDALHLFPNGVSSRHRYTARCGGRLPCHKGDPAGSRATPSYSLLTNCVWWTIGPSISFPSDWYSTESGRMWPGARKVRVVVCSFSITDCFPTTWRYRHENQSLSSSRFVSDKESFQRRLISRHHDTQRLQTQAKTVKTSRQNFDGWPTFDIRSASFFFFFAIDHARPALGRHEPRDWPGAVLRSPYASTTLARCSYPKSEIAVVLVYPFAYRSRRRWRTINRRRGGIESGCLRGIRDDNSFGDLRFSGRGELSCPFGLSTSQIFSDESAALVRGGFEQAELDVLLLLPECDKIADLQTTLIAATNKKDWRVGALWKPDPPLEWFGGNGLQLFDKG